VELRHLRYFVAVAEEGHFGRAAERLHLTTPTLSQQIRALEREVGAPLLVRHSRGVRLTPAGEALRDAGRGVLEAADGALAAARQAAGLAAGTFRLGLLRGIPDWLPERLEALLAEAAPGYRAVPVSGSTSDQLRMLEAGELDLALVRELAALPAGTARLALLTDELGVLVAGTHPLADLEVVRPADLAGRELLWYPRDLAPGLYDDVLGTLRRLGADVVVSESTVRFDQRRTGLRLRPEAFSLSSVRGADPPAMVWRPIEGAPLAMTVAAVWRTGSRHAALRALVPLLRAQAPLRP
jgi:DNA-binding transcriptional LysR family regulator